MASQTPTSDDFEENDALWQYANRGVPPFGTGESVKLSNWLGRVIYGYSAIEFQHFLNIAICSSQRADKTYVEFYSKRQVNHKESFALSISRHLPSELANANVLLWRRLRSLANERRKIAHSTISRNGTNFISMYLEGNDVRFQPLNHDLFARVIKQFRTLQTDAQTLYACTRLLNVPRTEQRLAELPAPRHARTQAQEPPDPDPLPPRAEVERIASLKRLELDQILFAADSPYPCPYPTISEVRYGGHLVLWLNP